MEYWVENKIPFDYVIEEKTLDWFEPYHTEYPYNAQILEILVRNVESCGFTLTDGQKDNVNRFIYVARQSLRKRKEKQRKERMLDDNWLVLDSDIVKKAFSEKKKLLVNASMDSDWITFKVDEIYKPFVTQEGQCYLLKPRAKSRGYHISRFENAFCRVI